ncbi:hypothetical protein [Streptomyces mexicanus]|uniref:hypothetical protein n=1 Tax=Streptomyces mexicanus TaxID=178566 RepID=UPI00135BE1D4|nr:hypothetical protein [Streptomyces mexicanus]
MPPAVLPDHERAAVRAYVRLLQTVRACFAGPPAAGGRPPLVPPSVLAEAERALDRAGLAGNEEGLFRLVRDWCAQP